jgi:hypothetical protein
MQLPLKQRNLYEESSPSFCAGRKLGDVEQALLWSLLQKDPQCPSRVLLDKATEEHLEIAVSLRHINRWRAARGLNRGKGRPGHADGYQPVSPGAEVVRVTPQMPFVGVHVFAHCLDQHDALAAVAAQLMQAIEAHKQTHPEDDFALLHHRQSTLLQRFKALFFAPLLGIERLSAFDTREHGLQTLLGRGYQSSTLGQFLGQLERVDAAEFLMSVLRERDIGSIIYVDGHMIAYWSRLAMHKGKITMLGRIMAGSHAVIAHDASGQAVFVAYYAPDIHVSQVILAYCHKVSEATDSIVFVIDRAANSVALAEAFDAYGMGLLCMLDDNEHKGLASFEATLVETLEDGTKVYSGPWKERRQDDRRHFVIVEPVEGKSLVYWGTPKVKEALEANEWPGVYRDRNEIQEHRFKDMIAHGALKINYGRKTLMGPDRHQQRKKEECDRSLEAARARMDKKAEAVKMQQDKVAESASKGHGKRLEQRTCRLTTLEQELKAANAQHANCAEKVSALGVAGQRADRDFRKQTIMTIRTLFLENMLRAFMSALLAVVQTKVSLQQVLELFFERSGSRMETASQIVYRVNTAGLSLANQRLLSEIVAGICTMGLQERGKPIHVRLKDMPP